MAKQHYQIIIYTSYLHIIGGIETFMVNFLKMMHDDYDIAVFCPKLPTEMEKRLLKLAPVIRTKVRASCDNLIMIRINDEMPGYIHCKQSIRMCHATRSNPAWHIKSDCDKVVHVSEASRQSFKSNGRVIFNPMYKTDNDALLIVSATRIPALDKGKNAERMLQLARMLNNACIQFLWLNFSDQPLEHAPKGFINAGTFQDIQTWIRRADYVVQLSDQEGFGYSVLEALINKTPVIVTPFETTKELGVIDGYNGYIVPFNLDFDVKKLLNVPEFEYSYDNEMLKEEWKDVLTLNLDPENAKDTEVKVIVQKYYDSVLKQQMRVGQRFYVTKKRAAELTAAGVAKIIGEDE